LRNKFLSDKLERLEQAFASRQPAGIPLVHEADILMHCMSNISARY